MKPTTTKPTSHRFAACLLATLFSIATCLVADGGTKEAKKETFVRVDSQITLDATEFTFAPNHLEVPVDSEVAITLKNEGVIAHNLIVVKDGETKPNPKLASVQRGNEDTLHVRFREAGDYRFYCNVPGHKEAGMTGMIRVVEE